MRLRKKQTFLLKNQQYFPILLVSNGIMGKPPEFSEKFVEKPVVVW